MRGRLGVAFNNSLLYVTGGAAWGDMDHTYVLANALFETVSTTRTGWTVGAGWEYGFTPNWSTRVEYRYTDFGTFRNNSTVSFPGFSYEHDPVFHTVRAGVSYRSAARCSRNNDLPKLIKISNSKPRRRPGLFVVRW
ncbi:outer membrane beta-barrel protein [Bradyrhizobium sp. 23AC]